jgi:hypothetical protein
VAQELIGTTVKLFTCTVVMKEVSPCTVGGGVNNLGNYVYVRGIEDHGRGHGWGDIWLLEFNNDVMNDMLIMILINTDQSELWGCNKIKHKIINFIF